MKLRRLLAPALLLRRILRACLGPRSALGDLHPHERQRLARLLDRRSTRRLDDLDRCRRAAAARHDDVAGDVRELELAGRADGHAARQPLGLGPAILRPSDRNDRRRRDRTGGECEKR